MKNILTLIILISFFSFRSMAQQKPNINFILAYDLEYKNLGCYSNPFIKTAVLNQMANDGMLFTEACANPACSPSKGNTVNRFHLKQYI